MIEAIRVRVSATANPTATPHQTDRLRFVCTPSSVAAHLSIVNADHAQTEARRGALTQTFSID
jgi:hypothetical protein